MSSPGDASTKTPPRVLDDASKALVRTAYDRLQANTPGFQRRRAQLEMVAGVSRALGTTHGAAVIEAGTGTGKTYAYLTAAALAIASGKKLVISTGTVALQEQLVSRDIPRFLKSTQIDAKVALGKGRQRFLCVRNLAEISMPATSDSDLFDEFEATASWSAPPTKEHVALVESISDRYQGGAWDGDLDALGEIPSEVRRLITTSSGGCSGQRCPFATKCPALVSRKKLKEADIMVVNHSLLMADLLMGREESTGMSLIADPENSLIVIDEGHQLPDVALSAAAAQVSLKSMATHLARVKKLASTTVRSLRGQGSQESNQKFDPVRIDELVQGINADAESLRGMLSRDWTPDPKESDPVWRAPMGRLPESWREMAAGFAMDFRELLKLLEAARRAVRGAELQETIKGKLLKELGIVIEQLGGDSELFHLWGHGGSGGAPIAKWLAVDKSGAVSMHASPVHAGPILESALWSRAESVVVTSATMGSGRDFTAFAESSGVPMGAEIMKLDTPFDLENQASLQVPWMSAPPNDHEGHCDAISTWLDEQLDWGAGTLVLFTSKRKLQDTLNRLPSSRRSTILAQGELSKQRLLEMHAARIESGQGSVIFGLASFGEGLDLTGDLLTSVVITQLPFKVPTDPLGATLAEWYESMGRNPFAEIAVPEAIRILTQYCGRLIRTVTDTGRICILDRRLIEKRYGQTILDALPPFKREIARMGRR